MHSDLQIFWLHMGGCEGGWALPLGTVPAGHGVPVEFCPEVVCGEFAEPAGVPVEFVLFPFVVDEVEELEVVDELAELEEDEFEPFMPGFVGEFVLDPLAVDETGTHGAVLGAFGVVPAGCAVPVAPGVGDGVVAVGAMTSWPVVVWFRFC